MGILVILDTFSFNLYYSKSVPILKTYYDYAMEAQRIKIEEQGLLRRNNFFYKSKNKIILFLNHENVVF